VTLRPAIFGIAVIGLFAAAMLPAVFARRDPLPPVGQIVELRAGVIVCATKAGSEASETEESPLRGCVLTPSPQVATVEAPKNPIRAGDGKWESSGYRASRSAGYSKWHSSVWLWTIYWRNKSKRQICQLGAP